MWVRLPLPAPNFKISDFCLIWIICIYTYKQNTYMPNCKLCNEEFPNRININGIIHSINRRKYCLLCSPFGEHNNKQLHIKKTIASGYKICPRCKIEKSIEKFYKRRNGMDFASYCKKCTLEEVKNRQVIFKQKCVEYSGGKCKICGYNKYIGALEFHHFNPSKKEFSISNSRQTSFGDRIKKELDKCILVCSNCHKEEHEKLRNNLMLS